MKKQLISFDSPPDPPPSYCEAIGCEHWDVGCLIGKLEWECEDKAEAKGEKIKELIREER